MPCRPCSTLRGASAVVVDEIYHLFFDVFEPFFAKMFVVKDEGGRCGPRGVGAFIGCRAWGGGSRRDVVPVAAREYGTGNWGEA